MTYHYNTGNNQLNHVADLVASGNYSVDIDNQSNNNYEYDAIGNLIKDVSEGFIGISWNVLPSSHNIHHKKLPKIQYWKSIK